MQDEERRRRRPAEPPEEPGDPAAERGCPEAGGRPRRPAGHEEGPDPADRPWPRFVSPSVIGVSPFRHLRVGLVSPAAERPAEGGHQGDRHLGGATLLREAPLPDVLPVGPRRRRRVQQPVTGLRPGSAMVFPGAECPPVPGQTPCYR